MSSNFEWFERLKEHKENLPDVTTKQDSGFFIDKISSLFQDFRDDATDLIVQVCTEIFDFYQRGSRWRQFSVECLPSIIERYLISVSDCNEELVYNLGALLLTFYNREVKNDDGSGKVEQIRLSSAENPSFYLRDPFSTVFPESLVDKNLYRPEREMTVVEIGPFPSVQYLTAESRFLVLTFLLRLYGQQVDSVSVASLESFCHMCHRVCVAGFQFGHSRLFEQLIEANPLYCPVMGTGAATSVFECPRLPVHPSFLIEALNVVYFVVFKHNLGCAYSALDGIHQRADYEFYSEVLIISNAIFNSLTEYARAGVQPKASFAIDSSLSPRSLLRDSQKLVTGASLRFRKFSVDGGSSDALSDGRGSPRSRGQQQSRVDHEYQPILTSAGCHSVSAELFKGDREISQRKKSADSIALEEFRSGSAVNGGSGGGENGNSTGSSVREDTAVVTRI